MRANKIYILFGAVVLLIMGMISLVASPVDAALPPGPTVHLPTFPIQASFWWAGHNYSQTIFSGIGTGYDLKDNTPYTGWCVEYTSTKAPGNFAGETFTVTVYSTYDPALPANLTMWITQSVTRTIPWDQINYAINHRQGFSDADVETTIFRLIDGNAPNPPIQLYSDSVISGTNFVPRAGQVVAVILTNGSGINASADDGWQENIVEVPFGIATAVSLSSFRANTLNNLDIASVGIPGLVLGLLGIMTTFGVKKYFLHR